jgi:hypothetical protein
MEARTRPLATHPYLLLPFILAGYVVSGLSLVRRPSLPELLEPRLSTTSYGIHAGH